MRRPRPYTARIHGLSVAQTPMDCRVLTRVEIFGWEISDGAVQFASASGQGSGKARKSVEQPRKMAVAGRKQCHSGKRIALAYKQVI